MSARDELRRALESSAIAEAIGTPRCAADCIAHVRDRMTDAEARLAISWIDLLIFVARNDALDEVAAITRRQMSAPLFPTAEATP